MSDRPPQNFGSAWIAAFNESRLGAGVSALLGLLSTVAILYEWSQLPRRTPKEVFVRVSIEASVLMGIFLWHAWSAWNKEHEGLVTADRLRGIAESALATKKANQSISDALLRIYDEGRNISRMVLFDDEDYDQFNGASKIWERSLSNKMKELGCQEYEINAVCYPPYSDIQKSPPFEEYRNEPLWNERKRLLFFYLDRLNALIHKYAEK